MGRCFFDLRFMVTASFGNKFRDFNGVGFLTVEGKAI